MPHGRDADPQQARWSTRHRRARFQPASAQTDRVSQPDIAGTGRACPGSHRHGSGVPGQPERGAASTSIAEQHPLVDAGYRSGCGRNSGGRVLGAGREPLAGDGPGIGSHSYWRPFHVPQGLDRSQEWQPQHQRPDVHCRHRCGADRPLAGSGDGNGAFCPGGSHRGQIPGSRPQCHPQAAGSGAGASHGAATRWQLAGDGGPAGCGRQPGAGAPR